MRRCLARELESLKGCAGGGSVNKNRNPFHSIHPYLSTALTHVRLLSGVNTLMDCQRRTLDELLAAVRVIAHVWAYTTVDTFYFFFRSASDGEN